MALPPGNDCAGLCGRLLALTLTEDESCSEIHPQHSGIAGAAAKAIFRSTV
jgi:hypothetical protein